MRMCIKFFFLGLCFLLASFSVSAQQEADTIELDSTKTSQSAFRQDTTHVTQQKFSSDKVETLKADPDLNYNDPPTVGESLWDRFLQWLGRLIGSLFRNTTFSGVGKLIMYGLGLALLIYIIMVLLKVNPMTFFLKGADVTGSAEVLHENIHEMDFEKLIHEATTKNDFRAATRLVFLYALKILSDKHLIDWNPGKTNYEYVQEIQQAELKDGFANLSTYFEYAWYGNFKVTPQIFDNMRLDFQSWRTKVEI
jgi:hypothetical protein